MGKITNHPEGDTRRLVIEMGLDELLNQPYYLPGENGDKPRYAGETIGDAIRRATWRKLAMVAPKLVQDKFPYGFVETVDGQVRVTFFRSMPPVPPAPGGP